MPEPSWIGQKIGDRYLIESLLGQGGMSAVYKGVDPNLRRPVAIKLIHAHLATDFEFVSRFEEEAAAVAQLRHPNIIQVYDFNHDGGTYFMVLEFVAGESLYQRLSGLHSKGQRLPQGEAIRFISIICDAVQYAHDRQIIHRDLKPANVMLNPAGQPILMDFGIAKIVGGVKHTATGAMVGTPSYISPEQVRGQSPDQRADIYALGIMLYEMLAGRVPFDADSALSVMLMHINEPVPDIHLLNRNVPDGLVAIVEKALAKDPNDRYQSARQMASALRPYLPPVQRTDTMPPVRVKSTPVREQQNTLPPTILPTSFGPTPTGLVERPRRSLWPALLILGAVLVFGLLATSALAVAIGSRFLTNRTPTQAALITQPATQVSLSQTPIIQPTNTSVVQPSATVPVVVEDTGVPPTVAPTAAVIPVPDGMSLVSSGFFQMGSDDKPDQQPIHPVLLDAYYIDTTEVTNVQYRACVQSGACTSANSSDLNNPTFDNFPVFGVNWNQSQAFCQAQDKRLPTEAEWEFAAAGPDALQFPWGNDFDVNLSAASTDNLQPVGSFPGGASPFKVLDMAGNISEWVADSYAADFYTNAPTRNPANTTGDEHVYRGGGYGNPDPVLYTTHRRWHRPAGFNDVDIGFRCAKDATEVNADPALVEENKALLDKFCAIYATFKPGAPCP
jgi:serine/threonine protein kinase